jgi:hypothetical protein
MRFKAISFRHVSLLAILAFTVSACGGAGNSTVASSSNTAFAVQPQSLAFNGQAGDQSTVTLSGGAPPYTVKAADARFVNVSPIVMNAGIATFTVTPVAGGTTTIAAKDSNSASAMISVSTQVCTPPAPETFLTYPATGASGISASLSQVWVADPNNDPGLSNLGAFAIRLVGSDGSNMQGADFTTTQSQPPPGSATPPSGPTYTYATSSVSVLKAGLTYQAQLTNSVYPCMPPAGLGTFST